MTTATDKSSTNWDAADHPRGATTAASNNGSFSDRTHTAPELTLAMTPDYDAPMSEFDRDSYNPTYRFPAHLIDVAARKVEIANNRLKKLGLEDRFEYDVEYTTEKRNGKTYEWANLTLNRPSISQEGWEFTGAHDFTPAGAVLRFNAKADAPTVEDNHCDHCGSKRARNRVYTIVHPEKGTMQIGASCLEAFLGIKPAGLWAIDDELELKDIEETYGDKLDVRSSVFDPQDLLIAALAASNDGKDYVSAANASYTEAPTSIVVNQQFDKLLIDGTTEERTALAADIITWARSLKDDNGYLGNIHSLFAGDIDQVLIRNKHFNLAVSTVAAYRNSMDENARVATEKKQKSAEAQEFLGKEGDKLENITATIQRRKDDSTNYSGHQKDSTWLVMVTDTGHVLSWTASSTQNVEVGQRVTISKATVKSNTMYNGSYQTKITRAKMEILED
jgi:hypothetical protein